MSEKESVFDWAFGLLWIATCAIGVAVGGAVAFFSMWEIGEATANTAGETIGGLVAGGLFGLLFGLGVNIGPGLLLRRKGINGTRWILYSALAAAASVGLTIALASQFLEDMSDAVAAVFIGLSLGLPVGIVQWLLLQQRGIAAGIWPLISAVAYYLGAILVTSTSEESNMALTLAAMGLIIGAVSGLGMLWLLRRQTAVAA